MGYLDKRLEKSQHLIDEKFPTQAPVIMLIDNINMYRGRRRHERLVRLLGPKMWNFTVRAALLPNIHVALNITFKIPLAILNHKY
jgi:hypothetical protein